MTSLCMKVKTVFGGQRLCLGDVVGVDDITAARWVKLGIAEKLPEYENITENGGEEECSPSEQTAMSQLQKQTSISEEITEAPAPTEADGKASQKRTRKSS